MWFKESVRVPWVRIPATPNPVALAHAAPRPGSARRLVRPVDSEIKSLLGRACLHCRACLFEHPHICDPSSRRLKIAAAGTYTHVSALPCLQCKHSESLQAHPRRKKRSETCLSEQPVPPWSWESTVTAWTPRLHRCLALARIVGSDHVSW